MPTLYVLVGLPASGKSTWADNFIKSNPEIAYVSTDSCIEEIARERGKTYNDVFNESMKGGVKQMMLDLEHFASLKRDIIWDQTSVSVASRKKKIKWANDHGYTAIAIYFFCPPKLEHTRRLMSRPGKVISKEIINRMKEDLSLPTTSEGFTEIRYV